MHAYRVYIKSYSFIILYSTKPMLICFHILVYHNLHIQNFSNCMIKYTLLLRELKPGRHTFVQSVDSF